MNNFTTFVHLHPEDDVAIVQQKIEQGTTFQLTPNAPPITSRGLIPAGHKIAVRAVGVGQPVHKYQQKIGMASADIMPGDWVHSHNLIAGDLSLDCSIATAIPTPLKPVTGRTFMGYRRADGRAATRNYIGIISTVNCSATASRYVVKQINQTLLEQYPNVDGVVAMTHQGGCAMQFGGEDHHQLARTLTGFARHPNFAAYILIGLGCETGQASFLLDEHQLFSIEGVEDSASIAPPVFTIQEEGGVEKTVQRVVQLVKNILPTVNNVERVPVPVSEIILGTECGGSDGNSGITANPALGIASDLLVAHGGTAILGETPEIYGGHHLLTERAINQKVGQKLLDRITWWEEYVSKFQVQLNNNPSVGNKAGGLTTIYEKSLGAIAKGGSTALRAVYLYAEQVKEKGFVFMDTPGYDPASVTGMIAGGANIIVFTTGRGSCFGCKPVPTIKVATNSAMYARMTDDMDIDAGVALQGKTLEDVGQNIFESIIAVASGEQTKSEAQGIGDEEFCPWSIGPVL